MAQANPKAGRMACETKGCGDSVWVRRTGAGKLAYRCEGCGRSSFVEPNDRAYRQWVKDMTPHVDDEAAPPPSNEGKPTGKGKPAAAPAAPGGFNIGQLLGGGA